MIIKKAEGQIIELRMILKHFFELPDVFDDIVSYTRQRVFMRREYIY